MIKFWTKNIILDYKIKEIIIDKTAMDLNDKKIII